MGEAEPEAVFIAQWPLLTKIKTNGCVGKMQSSFL